MAERLMSPEEAARKFNNTFVYRNWTADDMALFEVQGFDARGERTWVARIWLPLTGIESEEAVDAYWQTKACAQVELTRLPREAQEAHVRAMMASGWRTPSAKQT